MTQPLPRAAGASFDAKICTHCAAPLAGAPVVRRTIGTAEKSFCCLGCAFIAEQIHAVESHRNDASARGQERARPGTGPALAGSADRSGRSARPAGSPGSVDSQARREQIRLAVTDMVCSACAALIESRLRQRPGVISAQVDFAARRAWIVFDAARVSAVDLQTAIERCGYRASVAIDRARERRCARMDLARLLFAGLAMMQVMMLAAPAYFAAPGEVGADVAQLLRIAQLILTTPVILFSSAPLFRAAFNQLRARAVGMDLPIVLGLAAAFAASVQATVAADGAVYYDSITMFVAFVLGSRWLQARALAHARAEVDAVERAAQLPAQRLRVWPMSLACDPVAAEALAPGDHILVAAGEAAAADGRVVRGTSTLSLAWVSGESTPMPVHEGGHVLAGSVNLEQALVLLVTRSGAATSLAMLGRMVSDAGNARPRIVELGNRIAAYFLWLVLAAAVLTLDIWFVLDPSQAVPNALALLIATCPCALSLAAPAAFAAAQSRLARDGVLTARSVALQTLARADMLVMDKTGTLTDCNPELRQIVLLLPEAIAQPAALSIAAALEAAASHPFARALLAAAGARRVVTCAASDLRAVAGAGVEGVIDGRFYRIGTREFALQLSAAGQRGEQQPNSSLVGYPPAAKTATESASTIYLADARGLLAAFVFGERLRDDAHRLLATLRANKLQPQILSGDDAAAVRHLARALDVDDSAQIHARQTPADKRNRIARWQDAGAVVAMIGDGMNDAPAIAQADVSFALGAALGGSALAQTRADFIVTGSRLAAVGAAIVTARWTMRIVRQNFCWAIAYNSAAIGLAAFGYLTPALAAIGMAVSSLLVVGNALRILVSSGAAAAAARADA